MKRFLAAMSILVGIAIIASPDAEAADSVVCNVGTSTSAATTTALPATGTCSWSKGSVLLMQCNTDVYIDTAAVRDVVNPDAGSSNPDGGTTGGIATAADELVDFTNNKDHFPIYLGNADQHVSLLAASADGGCKFIKSQLRRPY